MEIIKEMPVSKGSLGYLPRGFELTPAQLARIQYKNDEIKDKFIKYNALKKRQSESRQNIIIANAIEDIGGISERELKLIGIALYWAEGYKGTACSGVELTNADSAMIKLMMRWFRQICGVG
ncbi:MAG: hypothetical protein PHW54_06545, partial [Candidatus Omnitrophica bacterium]|nr:hypothetical protein [Candidatus Omnitrophota bacterium]